MSWQFASFIAALCLLACVAGDVCRHFRFPRAANVCYGLMVAVSVAMVITIIAQGGLRQ